MLETVLNTVFQMTNITTGTVNDTVLSLPTNNFVMSNTAGFPQVPSTKQDVNTNPNAPLVMKPIPSLDILSPRTILSRSLSCMGFAEVLNLVLLTT